MLARSTLGLAAVALTGCGGGTGLIISFNDVVVEAPARNVDLLILSGDQTCESVLSKLHQSVALDPSVKKHIEKNYPLHSSDTDLLSGVSGTVTIDAQIVDGTGIQIARACQTVALASAPNPINLVAHTLPVCQALPTKLDIELVIDTSAEWSLVDAEHFHLQDFVGIVLDPTAVLAGTRFGIVTYGHKISDSPVNELLPPTENLDTVRSSIAAINDVQVGDTRMFDGLYLGTALSRARALCGVYSAVVVLAGGPERASTRRFEDAQIGFYSTPGDASDDLYLYGIAFTTAGFTDLDAVLPMGGHGIVTGAGSRPQWQEAYRELRTTLVGLVQPRN